MYPNPQDVLPLPAYPNLEQYRKRAKELARAGRSGSDAVTAWATHWVQALFGDRSGAGIPEHEQRDATRRARQLAEYARTRLQADGTLAQAQFVVARAHGFTSWPRLVRHIEHLVSSDPALPAFERAVDAIVRGDLSGLQRLLATHPGLVRERSSREHRATLLHYVSANGIENYRQRTPENIVTIARFLLDAGAMVDAEADVYGDGATTLGLVVTSAHPRAAGVQRELAELLLERGARLDAGIVRACLMNGCPEAAAQMADRGAPVGLEEAAGIGRLDLIARHFVPPGGPPAGELVRAFMMASWYDQVEVLRFFLDHGVGAGLRDPDEGQTALHIAAYRGCPATVELLLDRGAPVDEADGVYGTSPLVWALHAWLVDHRDGAEGYRMVLRQLADAGARVKREWLDDERLRADTELHTLLLRRTVT